MNNGQHAKLYFIITCYAFLFVAELVANQLTHSLTLLIDCYHNLYTTMSLILLAISHKMSNESTLKNTFGWARIEVLGALFNTIFFAALCFSVVVEGLQSLAHSSHEKTKPTYFHLLVAGGVSGLIIHFLLYWLVEDVKPKNEGRYMKIHGTDLQINYVVVSESKSETKPKPELEPLKVAKDVPTKSTNDNLKGSNVKSEIRSKQQLPTQNTCEALRVHSITNCRRPVTHFVRDFSSTTTLFAAYILMFTDSFVEDIADSIFGIVAVAILSITMCGSIKESALILLQSVPKTIDVRTLRKSILKQFPQVLNVHEMHVWCLTSSEIIATCHVSLPPLSTKDYLKFTADLNLFLAQKGINLATVQPEFGDGTHKKCLYLCKDECETKTCCKDKEEELNVSIPTELPNPEGDPNAKFWSKNYEDNRTKPPNSSLLP